MPDYSQTGLKNRAGTQYTDSFIRDYNAYDDTTADGFAEVASGYVAGRWDGKRHTQAIVNHAKRILSTYAANLKKEDGTTIWELLGKTDHIVPVDMTELADLLMALKNVSGRDAIRQLAFPAAFSCALFEPKSKSLDPQYARGNWYLAEGGSMLRLYVFFRNSRGLKPQDSGNALVEYNDIDNPSRPMESTDARRPLYANLLKRAEKNNLPCPVSMPSQANRWSSAENHSAPAWYVGFGSGRFNYFYPGNKGYAFGVRPVVAFTFVL